MDPKLKEVVAGETPTLLEADKANELIRAINAFRALTVSPQGLGKITLGEKNVVLDLTPLKTLFDQLSTVVSSFTTVAPAGGGGGGGGGGSSIAIVAKINQIIAALGAMTITATCDPVTRDIAVTLNINEPAPL